MNECATCFVLKFDDFNVNGCLHYRRKHIPRDA